MSNAVSSTRGRLDKIEQAGRAAATTASRRNRHRGCVTCRARFRKAASASGGRSCHRRARSAPAAAEPSLELRRYSRRIRSHCRTSAGRRDAHACAFSDGSFQPRHRKRTGISRAAAVGRAPPRRAGRRARRSRRQSCRRPPDVRSPGGDDVRQSGRGVARRPSSKARRRLARYSIQLFRPVEPMLASPAESVSDAIEAFGQAAFELKLDGARIQVHKSGDEVRVFSRALRDVTAAVPEVVEAVRPAAGHARSILDGEVLALRRDGTPLPFQETMRRFGRRLDVDRLRSELPLTPFFFDCLYTDGRPLITEPQRATVCGAAERRWKHSLFLTASSATKARPRSSSTAPSRVAMRA